VGRADRTYGGEEREISMGEGVDRLLLAKNSDRWRTLVNVVMNLRVLLHTGNFLYG
jgi:hypothetical protein